MMAVLAGSLFACSSVPAARIADAETTELAPDAARPNPARVDARASGASDAAPPPSDAAATPRPDVGAAPDGAPSGGGPNVDRASPQLHALVFKANVADPAATRLLGDQQAFLDTRVPSLGTLVVHLHGSGEKVTCGYAEHGRLLASFGFHVFMPCYDAAVSWSNGACGGDVGRCRLEMLEGTDQHPLPKIEPAQAVEVRMAKALAHLQKANPAGDWGYFLDGEKPRWPRIIISGQSFGGTSSLLIAKHRPVLRAVALSGPLDGGARWLKEPTLTPLDRMFAFTHVNDGQHPTHMASLNALGVPGTPVEVEKATPPFAGSHRLVGGMTTHDGARVDGHNATEARVQSPRDAATGKYLYEPVWRYVYGVP
jgi:hypothetical protein